MFFFRTYIGDPIYPKEGMSSEELAEQVHIYVVFI
jgi:hypothetical protein